MSLKKRRVLIHFPQNVAKRFESDFPDVEFISIPNTGAIDPAARGEVLLTYSWGSENLAEALECGVEWIHTIGTGVDRFPMELVGDRSLSCARGASAVPIAEWTLAMMLAFEKRLPEVWATEPPERWNFEELGGLEGKTLGLVGLGTIGCAIATRAQAFDMKVLAYRRSKAPSPIADVELLATLPPLLEASDHLVIAASATPETHHLIDAGALERVKPGVHLVNIARGSLVDQDALRSALDAGRVACASLDVCDPEPLPAGHWLYRHPAVRLSPHISWSMPGSIDRLFDTFAANLRRYLDGDPLANRVDLQRGY